MTVPVTVLAFVRTQTLCVQLRWLYHCTIKVKEKVTVVKVFQIINPTSMYNVLRSTCIVHGGSMITLACICLVVEIKQFRLVLIRCEGSEKNSRSRLSAAYLLTTL